MKKNKQQKTPSNQALLLFYSWLETKLTKWVHLSPGVVIVFSPSAAPAAHYRVFRSDWCVWGWFGARGRHWVLSLRGHPGLEVMTEPGDLRVKNKVHSMLCGRQDTLKVHFILCQQRIFFPVHNPLPQVAALWTPHKPGAIPACVC